MSKKDLSGLNAVFETPGTKPDQGKPEGEKAPAPQAKSKPPARKPAKPKKPASPVKAPGKARTQNASGAKKKPGAAPEGKAKVTYYINAEIVRKFKHLCVDLGCRDSALAEQAMEEIIRKHERKRN